MTAPQDINQNGSVVFFGGSSFSLPTLERVHRMAERLLVVTHAPTRVGRKQTEEPSLVALWAREHHCELVEVRTLKDQTFQDRLNAFQPRVGISASFGMIFPSSIIERFPRGIINVHPSLLPRHRGSSPVQWTIHEGDAETGVTLFLIDAQVDHGPVIAQRRMPTPENIAAPALLDILGESGAALVEETLPRYLSGALTPVVQHHDAATITPMLTKDTGRINWQHDDAAQIERNIRAFTPWPGVWTSVEFGIKNTESRERKMLKILAADILPRSAHHPEKTGSIFLVDGRLAIQTIDGLLSPTHLQLEGGKPMSVDAFLRGHTSIVGTTCL